MDAPTVTSCPRCGDRRAKLWPDDVVDCPLCGIYDVAYNPDGTLKVVEDGDLALRQGI